MAQQQQYGHGFQPAVLPQGSGQQYGMGPVGQQYGAGPSGQQYGAGPSGQQYGAGPSGQQYGMGPGDQQDQSAVSQQPGSMGFADRPGGGVPLGLEYLTQVDQLLVQQKGEIFEALTDIETRNTYTVKNSLGQKVYFVKENTDICTRLCCGTIRPFDIEVKDGTEREVLHLSRPLRCQGCCCPCCLQELEVRAGGQVIGIVRERWTLLHPKLTVHRPDGSHVLTIRGPICPCSLCGDVDFSVLSADGSREVGKISKQWTGLVKEMFTDADNFGISFPMDLDVNMKATLLGALFLVDYMFFERNQN